MASTTIADLERLLPMAQRETSRQLLAAELARLQAIMANSAMPPPPPPPQSSAAPAPTPQAVSREVVPHAGPVFSKISKYAWDQSKKFVKVYVTLPGIEQVPDEQVRLDVHDNALTFEVRGLPPPTKPPNARLEVRALYCPVDSSQCSWARKADSMVLLKLRKASDGEEWGSLDDSAKLDAKRKEEQLAENQGKSTAELLSQMYANADEEGKKSLSKAWETGRAKREGRE